MIRNTYKVIFENGGTYEDYAYETYFVWAKSKEEAESVVRTDISEEGRTCDIFDSCKMINDLVYIGYRFNESFIIDRT